MSRPRSRCRPVLEALEERLALSAAAPAGVAPALHVDGALTQNAATPPAGDTLAILNAFTHAYRSQVGGPRYNPAFDLNHNGQIGQADAKLLLRALPPLGPKVPLTMYVTLAPQDRARGPLPQNSGGVTHIKDPTVLGHTTPGALVYVGTGTIDVKLRGPVLVADAKGDFSYKINLTDGINQLNFEAVDHYGQQDLRAFPILWLNFAQYENAHPTFK